MKKFHALKRRSFLKAFLYRIVGSATTFIVALIWTRKISVSAGVFVADFILKTILLYVYERVWDHIQWGRAKE